MIGRTRSSVTPLLARLHVPTLGRFGATLEFTRLVHPLAVHLNEGGILPPLEWLVHRVPFLRDDILGPDQLRPGGITVDGNEQVADQAVEREILRRFASGKGVGPGDGFPALEALSNQDQFAIGDEEAGEAFGGTAEVVVIAGDQVLQFLALDQGFECDFLCLDYRAGKQRDAEQGRQALMPRMEFFMFLVLCKRGD